MKALIWLVVLVVPLALSRTAGAEPLDFGPDLSRSGWVVVGFPGIPPASFKAIDRSALKVSTEVSAGLVWWAIGDGLRYGRLASWRWTATEGVSPTDLTKRGVDDSALGVYFVFGTAADATKSPLALLGSPSVTALVYVFGGDKPRGSISPSPPHGERAGNSSLFAQRMRAGASGLMKPSILPKTMRAPSACCLRFSSPSPSRATQTTPVGAIAPRCVAWR